MTDATEAALTPIEAAQLILDWVELSGEGPPTAWPTTAGCAVMVARALLAGHDDVVERCAQVADTMVANRERVDDKGGIRIAHSIAFHIRALKTGSKP